MPVVFRYRNVRFHFFSLERGNAPGAHAESSDGEAKFWLYPEVRLARSAGYSRRRLSEPARVVGERREEIERAWNEHFG
ncbi:MAG: DUF4160 domain-containing protein [Defluviicoccus sp.]|nr:DUF4160 domain-containing protein [Defluviicoccus sp.]